MMKPGLAFFNILLALFLVACSSSRSTQVNSTDAAKGPATIPPTDTLLRGVMERNPVLFDSILQNPRKYRIQVIYTQVNRNGSNTPSLTHHYYQTDPGKYFYPASTVKLPVAILALQRLKEIRVPGLDRNSTMVTDAAGPDQTAVLNDPTSEDGRPSIAHYIKKILLVSDNDAYNRLYEFLGQTYINNSLHRMGYDSVQILHRLSIPLTEEQNRNTNPVRFFDPGGRLLYSKPALRSSLVYQPRNIQMGKAFIRNGERIEAPFDLSAKNRLPLNDLHTMLTALIFPEAVPRNRRFAIDESDRLFLLQYLSMKPTESRFPSYDSSYTDAYSKFLFFGGKGEIPRSIRMFSKSGDAYGFLTDAAYIVDLEKGIEFFVSATIYCNSDETFNDDQYDYETIGLPFMQQLGQVLYQHELNRNRKIRPDLSAFELNETD